MINYQVTSWPSQSHILQFQNSHLGQLDHTFNCNTTRAVNPRNNKRMPCTSLDARSLSRQLRSCLEKCLSSRGFDFKGKLHLFLGVSPDPSGLKMDQTRYHRYHPRHISRQYPIGSGLALNLVQSTSLLLSRPPGRSFRWSLVPSL